MVERWDRLRQFRFPWPVLDAARLASATRWLMLAVIATGLVWLWRVVLRPGVRARIAKEAE
jgi:nitroreductase